MRRRTMKRWVCCLVAGTFLSATSAPAMAFDSAVARSVIFPGAGQAHDGHYTRAALFATAAVFSGFGVFFTQIHYDRAVERFEDQKRTYLAYEKRRSSGGEVRLPEIEETYDAMTAAYDQADERLAWRNVFLGALITTYVLNLADVLLSKPDTGETTDATPYGVELRDHDVYLVRTFSFQ